MAPSRKTTHLNKQAAHMNAVRKKDGDVSRTKLKKRKLGDMGPQWSSKELQRFYEAYRKYGNEDWRKVAAAVRGRTVNMVEALYNNNMAYLSLPEGTATVTGLIAMVTDHYNMMERSDSDQESNEDREESQKPLKRSRRKYPNSTSKDVDASLSVRSPAPLFGATSDCLSLLKANLPGSEFRIVGKRTPRVAVAQSNDRDTYLSPKTCRKFKMDADDHVAHEIALALTKASQKDKSPRASHLTRASLRKTGNVSSPTKNDDRMRFVQGTTSAQLCRSLREEQDLEGSMGSIGTDNAEYVRRGSNLRDREGTIDIQKKGKRFYGKKSVTDTGIECFDDMKEACSGTEEQNSGPVSKKRGYENSEYLLAKGSAKRSKKVVFDEDEINALEALNTLADLSLSMPEPYSDYETKGAEITTFNAKGKTKHLVGGVEGNRNSGSSQKGENVVAIPDSEDKTGPRKRKPPKSLPASMETSKSEKRKLPTHEDIEEMIKSASKDADYQKEGGHAQGGTVDVNHAQGDFPTNTRSRRKKDLPKTKNHEDVKSVGHNKFSGPVDGGLDLKAKLANCLSWRKAQQWCTFEWFYSAIDYPWFARREFVEYLDHVGLGHIPRLTRVEWGVIRSSLGKPRRFSQHFLKEEKVKLNLYRETVRDHYTEHRKGREGLPTDLARPLFVGQQVIAIHPKTREIHDGKVLTVDRDRCLVQFDLQELGVDFVMDIDCMPLNPLENMPAALAMSKLPENCNNGKLNGTASGHLSMSNGNMNNTDCQISRPLSDSLADSTKLIKDGMSSDNAQIKARSNRPANEQLALNVKSSNQIQPKEVDVQAIYEMTLVLDKKEIIVSDLRRMNDEVEEKRKRDGSLEEQEAFKQRYASGLLQLRGIDEKLTSSLRCLRQRNAYQGNSAILPGKPTLVDMSVLTSSVSSGIPDTPKMGTHVTEIAESSRKKAQMMVNAAIQAMSSLKNNAYCGADEAIDYLNSHLSLDGPGASVQHTSTHADSTVHNTLKNNVHIPSELITSCVATLFMIQKCTEREIPPSDVAQILDIAVTSLHPCSPQNLPVYSEIQKCMGIIRSQIMARIRI